MYLKFDEEHPRAPAPAPARRPSGRDAEFHRALDRYIAGYVAARRTRPGPSRSGGVLARVAGGLISIFGRRS